MIYLNKFSVVSGFLIISPDEGVRTPKRRNKEYWEKRLIDPLSELRTLHTFIVVSMKGLAKPTTGTTLQVMNLT